MRSSSGAYYAGLDHVRALAAFLVVTWHFAHWGPDYPVVLDRSPLLGPLDEGHIGVSLFMTLSGYLFAKLIGEQQIRYLPFLWNRAIRLLPLLLTVLSLYGLMLQPGWPRFLFWVGKGAILPTLPNGAWSVTAEFHFYVMLPLLLAILRPRPSLALACVGLSIGLRLFLYAEHFDIQFLAYHTIFGRFDQFVFGIVAFRMRGAISGKVAILALAVLWTCYAAFGRLGGYYHFPTSAVWIMLPTLEGLTLAPLIAWYDRNPITWPGMGLVRKAGEYSYSIYLLHFFFVAPAAAFVDTHIMHIPTLLIALPWAVLFFLGMIAVGHLSWTLIEQPPLRWRKPYLVEGAQQSRPAHAVGAQPDNGWMAAAGLQ